MILNSTTWAALRREIWPSDPPRLPHALPCRLHRRPSGAARARTGAALRLGRIGFDHVKGYLHGGMAALAGRPDLVWPTELISAPMVAEELASADPPLLLDIRNPREWATRHIENSMNIPLNHLQERIAEIPRDRRIAVHCAGGYRSSIAAGILHQHGIIRLIEMAGGLGSRTTPAGLASLVTRSVL